MATLPSSSKPDTRMQEERLGKGQPRKPQSLMAGEQTAHFSQDFEPLHHSCWECFSTHTQEEQALGNQI